MDEYIKRMVDEFLRWKLPADFAPDGGISHNFGHLTPTSPLWPVGTNLFTASQATDMFARCANSLIEDLARKDADCHSNGLRVETLESELARVREERDELRALLDELRIAVMEMHHDNVKGDFELPPLARIDLDACVAKCSDERIPRAALAKQEGKE